MFRLIREQGAYLHILERHELYSKKNLKEKITSANINSQVKAKEEFEECRLPGCYAVWLV
jgi:hypothetical protein